MYIENVNKLDTDSILSDDLFIELFAIEDEITRQRKYYEIEDRAAQLKCTQKLKKIYSLYLKKEKQLKKDEVVEATECYAIDYPEKDISFKSGFWQADEFGIFITTDNGKVYACPHPIIPVGILRNAADGTCKTQLCFKVRGRWTEMPISRDILASANRIVGLSAYGVQVTSENARLLVRYLSDVESLNPELIAEHTSTSRLGWIGKEFMPYESGNIIFDNDPKLMTLFHSIKQIGDREKWYKTAREIRKEGHIEVLLYMAASLASVLVEPCGALPFIVSLWGGTGLGKTVALMLATSIWADPSEGQYMSDAKATTTAMEIRLDALNSLPMMVDDMAQLKVQDDDFSQIIYRWCAGKGRDRSNQSLGLNALTNWRNCTLTNGERSLTAELTQGGASNRVIDVEISETMFQNGNKIAKTLRKNFGWCGKEFVKIITKMGFEELNKRFEKWCDTLKQMAKAQNDEKEDKQINPMALILLADEIAEKELYKDGVRLNVEKCLSFLRGKNDISENIRAYEYMVDTIIMNRNKFYADENGDYRFGCWGKYLDDEHKQLAIIPNAFNQILKEGGFQKKSFLSWCDREGLVEKSCGKYTKSVRVQGDVIRCIIFRTDYDPDQITDLQRMQDTSDIPFE